jgi:outer membrane beta-barrel protein
MTVRFNCVSFVLTAVLFLALTLSTPSTGTADEVTGEVSNEQWKAYVASQTELQKISIVQNRLIDPTERYQVGLNLGTIERRDFTVTNFVSIHLRHHYNRKWAWEILKATFSSTSSSTLLTDVEKYSPYPVDAKRSSLQLSSSLVMTPIYGKYTWWDQSIAHFDVYAKLGAGGRRADVWQPFINVGLGSNHFFNSRNFSIAPEFEIRIYREKRVGEVTVAESVFQLGGSWLF